MIHTGSEQYKDSPFISFDGPYPDEFRNFVAVLPLVVSVTYNFGWNLFDARAKVPSSVESPTEVPDPKNARHWRVVWGNHTYTVREWNDKLDGWDMMYGTLTKKGFVRSKRRPKGEDHQLCFRRLECVFEEHEYSLIGGKRLAELFRVDMFNNVVTFDAGRCAMTAMAVDHIFPFIRGGKCDKENYIGLHHLANSRKGAHILQSLDPQSMQVGFSKEDIRAFFFGFVESPKYLNEDGKMLTRGQKSVKLNHYVDIFQKALASTSTTCQNFVERKRELVKSGLPLYKAMKVVLDDCYNGRPLAIGLEASLKSPPPSDTKPAKRSASKKKAEGDSSSINN